MTRKHSITIVAFGDSITEAVQQVPDARWPELLGRALSDWFPAGILNVINAGIGGNTSREGLQRIERDVLAHEPQYVLVEFGNDCTPEPERHVSLEEYAANLNKIMTMVAARSNGRLVMLTFPPVVDQWLTVHLEFYRQHGGGDAYQEQYRQLTRQFARDHGLPLADIAQALREAMARQGPAEYILPDGVHLTTLANKVVADVVLTVLGEAIAGEFFDSLAAGKRPAPALPPSRLRSPAF